MKAVFKNAWGYQGDAMNLPVANLEASLPFYTDIMGFDVVSHGDSPHRSAVLERPDIQIGLAENGGDPEQDGCAFEVDNVEAVFAEFKANGFDRDVPEFKTERNKNGTWKVFYVVAPDGLCYWLGEKQAP
ncbi:MAG: VOC family protein [Saprospiraceae bacterium]|nr:VOC family protein [Pyrinomonadaceae bacterium]